MFHWKIYNSVKTHNRSAVLPRNPSHSNNFLISRSNIENGSGKTFLNPAENVNLHFTASCLTYDIIITVKHLQVLLHQEPPNMNLQSSLAVAWDWSKTWHLPINSAKCNYLTIGRKVPLRLSSFPTGLALPSLYPNYSRI